MSYNTAVVTNDSAPSTTLLNAIESALTAHPAWEFVEETASGGYTYRIWKNLGTKNTWGQDFYVWFARTTSGIDTSDIRYGAMEGWNSASKTVVRGAVPTNTSKSSSITANPTTHAVYDDFLISSKYGPIGAYVSTSTVTFTYRIFINANRIALWTSGSYSDSYAGVFEPLWDDLPTEFPLLSLGWGAGYNMVNGGFSRVPFRGSVAARAIPAVWSGVTHFYFYATGSYYPGYGTLGSSYIGIQNGVMGARVPIIDQNAASSVTYGTGIRGHAYGILIFSDPGGYAAGDTITVDGVQHIRLSSSAWYSVED